MLDELHDALECLLDELRPRLKPIPKTVGMRWVRDGNQFQQVEVDTTESHRAICVIPALFAAMEQNSPAYRRLVDAIVADPIFRNAEKRAGYHGTPRALVESAVITAVLHPTAPVLDFDSAWRDLMQRRELIAATALTWRVRARVIGLELEGPNVPVADDIELVRLSAQEIDEKSPVLEAFAPADTNDEIHFRDHTTELRALITLQIDPGKQYSIITTGSDAQRKAYELGEDVLLALRLSWPGHISYRNFEISGPGFGTVSSNYLGGFYSIVGSMKLPSDAEAQVREAMKRLKEARDDAILRTSLDRFLIGRAPRAPRDQIVDYAIAWESILLTVDGGAITQESAFRFSINGASLLCASGAEPDRQRGAGFMKRVYDVRSAIVHGGSDKKISDAIRKTGFDDAEKLGERLEAYYRAAFAWLVRLPANKRPYHGKGWDDLLWRPTPSVESAQVDRDWQVLDRFLNPVRDALTPEVAKAIADLRADPATQQLIEDLADRHHEGKLTPEELDEYDALVSATNVIAVLQAKARSVLNRAKTP